MQGRPFVVKTRTWMARSMMPNGTTAAAGVAKPAAESAAARSSFAHAAAFAPHVSVLASVRRTSAAFFACLISQN